VSEGSGIREVQVPAPSGQLHARVWAPTEEQLNRPDDAFVLLHDSLGSVELWREFPALLSQTLQRPVVAYDRLGYGHSDPATGMPPPNFVSLEASAGLVHVMNHLQIDCATLVGHSVGGGMGVYAGVQMPQRVRALITIAAQAFPEDRTLKAIAEAKVQFQDESQLARLKRYHGDKARWVVDAWTDSWLSPAFARWHLREVLPQLRCPVLALHGDHDEYGTAIHPETIIGLCGGPSRMVLMPDTHHLPHRERPEAVVAAIAAFLAAL
jgi:pimeloyl-ACP methyl ester carboxylesterase